ncbi:unnamed protein product [Brassicogethes aeneus]|uniref:C2H2-type domain-containing protein n=1 Tax=Brassicogethes aeneus TaxID=1431903 RepID=A0A9P0BC49_BRAAE|nr:unnamed protein product [Brassicogethes aeneus]
MSRRKQSNPAKLDSGRVTSPLANTGKLSPVPGPSGLQTACESVMSRQSNGEDSELSDSRSSPPISHESLEIENSDYNYTCSICSDTFTTGQQLIDHEQIHSDHLQFTCSYCPRLFKHKRSRDRHTKLHTGDKKYKCLQCESAFSRSDHLKIHLKTHDSRKPYKCGSCNRGYNTAAALSSHQQVHLKLEPKCSDDPDTNSPTSFRCHLCPNAFYRPESLQNHLMNSHIDSPTDSPASQSQMAESEEGIKIMCMYCTKDFPTLDLMCQHVNTIHKNLQNGIASSISPKSDQNLEHNSQYCNSDFTHNSYNSFQLQPTDLSKRQKNIDGDEEIKLSSKKKKRKIDVGGVGSIPQNNSYGSVDKPCICSCCYAQLPNFKSFLHHMETHMISANNALLGFCPICGDPNVNTSNFSSHIFGHAVIQVSGLCCYTCKKTFEHMEKLQKHLIDVHVVNVYKCSICNEIFDTKLSMQLHLTSKHSEECKYYKCNLCSNQVFNDKLSAELHISMKHQQFAACISNKSLIQSQYQLDLNSRVDYGIQLQCAFCEKSFNDKYSQYVHILNEHSDVPKKEEKYLVEKSKSAEKSELKMFSCDICHISDLPSEVDLINHKKNHTSSQQSKSKSSLVSLQCAYCNEYCKSRSDLENHMKTHQVSCGKGKHKCNICDEIFTSSITLADHKLNHCKIVEGNTCVQCKSILCDEQSFYHHQLQHSNKIIKQNSQISLPANCIVCCQTLQTDIEIKLHAKFHLKHLFQNEFICGVCNKIFDIHGNINIVNKKNCDNNITVSICKECSNLNNNEIKTKFIPAQPLVIGDLKCKMEPLHQLNDEQNQECFLCKQDFVSPYKLQTHLIEHNFFGMNQYSCYVCSSVFTAAAGLQNHIMEHGLDTKPYECNQCQSKFFFRTELDNHRFTHVRQSPSSSRNSYTPTQQNYSNGNSNGDSKTDYKTCQYCSNTFIDNAFYLEHLTQCPFKIKCQDDFETALNVKVEVKEEIIDDNSQLQL